MNKIKKKLKKKLIKRYSKDINIVKDLKKFLKQLDKCIKMGTDPLNITCSFEFVACDDCHTMFPSYDSEGCPCRTAGHKKVRKTVKKIIKKSKLL
jgi:hypothetical protein